VLLGRKCGSSLAVVGSLVLMWWLIVWSNNYVVRDVVDLRWSSIVSHLMAMWLLIDGDGVARRRESWGLLVGMWLFIGRDVVVTGGNGVAH
jgi:hypothetical protein